MPVVIGLLAVIGFQTIMLVPLHESLDLPEWDESNQMAWGAEFAAGTGTLKELSASPLYNLSYALPAVMLGRIGAIFGMKYAVTLVLSSLLFVMLFVHTRRMALPFLLCVLWSVSQFNLAAPLGVYHFAACLLVLAILACNVSRLAALLLLLLACLARLEYVFVLVPYAAYCVVSMRRSRDGRWLPRNRVSVVIALTLATLALFTAWHVERWDLGGSRSWHAFGQHYALAEREAGRTDVNPWLDYDAVLQTDFPDSRTTVEALTTNPRAFGRHIARNLALVPAAFAELGAPYRLKERWPVYTPAILLLAGAVIIVAVRSSARDDLRRVFSRAGDVVPLGLASVLAVFPCLLIRPKASYLLPLLPFLLLGMTVLTDVAWRCVLGSRRERRVSWIFAGVGVLLVCISSSGHRPFDEPGRSRPVLQRVTKLESLWPDRGPVRLLGVGASTYANYLGRDRCQAIEPFASVGGSGGSPRETRLGRLIEIHRPDAVLINPWLLQSRGFEKSSLRVLTPDRWERHRLNGEDLFFAR